MNHRGIWLTATVLAVVVLLAQIAGAATREENASVATTASVSAGLTGTAWTVSPAEQASSVHRDRERIDRESWAHHYDHERGHCQHAGWRSARQHQGCGHAAR